MVEADLMGALGDLGAPVLYAFDFDGTLAPIVEQADRACIDARCGQLLQQLASGQEVAVISGRGLADLRERLPKARLHLAGSHGLEIELASGQQRLPQEGDAWEEVLERSRDTLAATDALKANPGLLELKRYGLAVHFRPLEDPHLRAKLERSARGLAEANGLEIGEGKEVLELSAPLEGDKGEALTWMLEQMGAGYRPFYIGDDRTDEDAFAICLQRGGLAIRVLDGESSDESLAQLSVEGIDGVHALLRVLVAQMSKPA